MKREIELPTQEKINKKLDARELPTAIEHVFMTYRDKKLLKRALQEAYDQGYGDASSNQWRPIEEAPRDGTRYIGAYRYKDVWFAEVIGDHAVINSSVKLFPATHWQPLPEPPSR